MLGWLAFSNGTSGAADFEVVCDSVAGGLAPIHYPYRNNRRGESVPFITFSGSIRRGYFNDADIIGMGVAGQFDIFFDAIHMT